MYADNIKHFYSPPGLAANQVEYFQGVEFPAFVYEDSVFPQTSACRHCAPGFFLSENTCRSVDTADAIDNCLEYESASTCAQCDLNFVLSKEKYRPNPINLPGTLVWICAS